MNMAEHPFSAFPPPPFQASQGFGSPDYRLSCGRDAASPGEQSLPAVSASIMETRRPEPYPEIIGGNL
jgi:hypothetical protein